MRGIEDLSIVERLKILKSIRLGCASDLDFEIYLDSYSGDLGKSEAKRRIDGLLLEDEFLLLCKLMKSCYSINGLDQGLTIDNGFKVPDYIAVFDTRNCLYNFSPELSSFSSFVEVKTTVNAETSKLSRSFLKKYSDYAALFNLPLLIASRLKINEKQQWWIVQTQQQFEDNGRKTGAECLTNSVGHMILNDFFITANQNIHIEHIYSNQPSCSEIYYPQYGYLHSVTIRSDGWTTVLDRCNFALNLFLDCFAQEEVSIKHNDGFVSVTRLINFNQSQLLSDMLLRANFSILDSNGSEFSSASRLLALLENGKAAIIYRDFFEKALSFFNETSMLFMVTKIGNKADNREIWASLHSSS